ncbi:MAG: protein phosphatase 2C domain-containing protein [Planctomycetaceae bacterium]|nr:protein phosphatase 2C domain-containing protein [Planctomycetaceae bacterium]MCA9085555.1 protein phosphatase 2C domain-containing protein [Planctomycetaceae bacterium]
MWKTVYDSVAGTSHINSDLPCQDACRVVQLIVGETKLLVACLADGAGSASHADEGAQVACDTFIQTIEQASESFNFDETIHRETAIAWCNGLRSRIVQRASELDVDTRQLACTFLGAVVTENSALFIQIGDGAIVRWNGDGYRHVFWPQSGEFANTTNFLTDKAFIENLDFTQIRERVDELAIFSDGLERLVLRFADQTVHEPFLSPLFATLRHTDDPGDYFQPLREFLDSEKVNERTDDDKTLILTTRLR